MVEQAHSSPWSSWNLPHVACRPVIRRCPASVTFASGGGSSDHQHLPTITCLDPGRTSGGDPPGPADHAAPPRALGGANNGSHGGRRGSAAPAPVAAAGGT